MECLHSNALKIPHYAPNECKVYVHFDFNVSHIFLKCAGSVLFQLNQVNIPAAGVLAMKQAAARIVIT